MKSKLSVLLAFVCLIGVAAAQERGAMRGPIHGRVTDASGRPIPGVRVILEPLGDAGGGKRVATTSSRGEYRFSDIPEGYYRLIFEGVSERPVVEEITLRKIVLSYGGSSEHGVVGPRREVYPPGVAVDVRGDKVAVRSDEIAGGQSIFVHKRNAKPKPRPTSTPLITTLPPDDPPKVNPTPAATPKPKTTSTPKPLDASSPRVGTTPTPHGSQTANTSAPLTPTAPPGGSEATNTAGTIANPSPPGALSVMERQIQEQIQEMKKASIAFNVPEAMSYEEVRRIKLVLSPSKSKEEVAGMVQEPGHIERESDVRYAPLMEAHLTGTGFDITPIPKETKPKPVVSGGETVWNWDVKALKPGRQRLDVTMNALIMVNGSERAHGINTYTRDVYIEVSWRRRAMDFGANNWQWLWAALGIPAATWFWNNKRKKKVVGEKS